MKLEVVRQDEQVTHVALTGRMDTLGTSEVEAALLEVLLSRKRPAIVDMAGVSMLSSMGIRALIQCAKGLRAAACKLVLAAPQAQVDHTLRLGGLDRVLPIVPDVAAAEEELKKPLTVTSELYKQK